MIMAAWPKCMLFMLATISLMVMERRRSRPLPRGAGTSSPYPSPRCCCCCCWYDAGGCDGGVGVKLAVRSESMVFFFRTAFRPCGAAFSSRLRLTWEPCRRATLSSAASSLLSVRGGGGGALAAGTGGGAAASGSGALRRNNNPSTILPRAQRSLWRPGWRLLVR